MLSDLAFDSKIDPVLKPRRANALINERLFIGEGFNELQNVRNQPDN